MKKQNLSPKNYYNGANKRTKKGAKSVHPFGVFVLAIYFSFLWIIPIEQVSGEVFLVESDAQLVTAINAANSGDTIRLAPGEYDAISFTDKSFTSYVTITSVNKNNQAKLGNVEIVNSSFVRIDSVEIQGSGSQVVDIRRASHDIQILNSDIHGELLNRDNPSPNDFTASFGVRSLENATRITLQNNRIHDVKNATAFFSGQDIVLKGNQCDWVLSDCFKFAGIDTLLFENNFGARNIVSLATSHVDFMQAQGSVKNGVFRGNVAIMGNESFQGLFFGGKDVEDAHQNNLIENNIIYMKNGNGITFNQYSSGNIVRFNTVLHSPKEPIRNVSVGGDVREYNVIISRSSQSRIEGTNHYIQYEQSNEARHYNRYYKDLAKEATLVSIEDFRPVENSPAADQVGAYKRIYELLADERTKPTVFIPAIQTLLNSD